MTRLSATEIYDVARLAGFSPQDAVTWTAIALAESGGDPRAHNTRGEDSRGLWQVNLDAHENVWGDLYDPLTNARAAYEISGHGDNRRPWTVTHAFYSGTPRDYRQYLDEARLAAERYQAPRDDGPVPASGIGQAGGDDPACRPVSDAALTDTFGAARAGGRVHEGIDIFADRGTPVHAVASGTVVGGFSNRLGGTVVRIEGDDGRYYYYAHLVADSVRGLRPGQHVAAGEVIGQVGNTGDAAGTSPHLHLQIRENGEWINPYDVLRPLPDYEEALDGERSGQSGDGEAEDGGDPFDIDPGAPVQAADTDRDGLTDEFEKMFGTDPERADSDGDQLSDAYETSTSHTDPLSADTDRDEVPDRQEMAEGSDAGQAEVPDSVQDTDFAGLATLDSDSDLLSDAYERQIGTDPHSADSDADTVSDMREAALGGDPLALDTDADGLTDPFELAAGTLAPAPDPGAVGDPVPASGAGTGAVPDLQADPDHTT